MGRERRLFRRHVVLPSDHGSWVLLLSPLAIGILAGWLEPSGSLRITSLYLVVASVSAFLARQPVTLLVKILAGRRSRDDLAPALLWSVLYTAVAAVHVVGLVLRGFAFLLALAIPGSLVFIWYLVLVARREERRQIGLDVLAAGALALAAPAGLWLGLDRPDPHGWLLWILLWAQSAAALVHVYGRLVERRTAKGGQVAGESWSGAGAGMLLAVANVVGTVLLAVVEEVPVALVVPYLLQFIESVLRLRHPAPSRRPSEIGLRQMWVSAIFSVIFLMAWVSGSR